MSRIIHIAAALIIGLDGRTLLVRKAGTTAFMQPGGKIEPGERAEAALIRELAEELGLAADPGELKSLGQFEAVAAHEPDATVRADCFLLETGGAVAPAGEIAELLWIDPLAPPAVPLAPLTADRILPLWRSRLRS